MISRRDVLIASACAVAGGAALALKPRHHVALIGAKTMDVIVPRTVGAWSSRDVGDLVAPKTEGSLMAKLYSQTVQRIYQDASTGAEVMMLLAYGDTQSNDLQLHRPEVCYPAFGFAMSDSRPVQLPLAGAATLPSRQLVANAPGRRECIVYWSRLGEFLPINGNEQRADRLRTAMRGVVADGLLARFSMLGSDPVEVFGTLEAFIPSLLRTVAADQRAVLIGTERAMAMAAVSAKA